MTDLDHPSWPYLAACSLFVEARRRFASPRSPLSCVSGFVQHAVSVSLWTMSLVGERCSLKLWLRPAVTSPQTNERGPTGSLAPGTTAKVITTDPDDLRRLDPYLDVVTI